MRIPGRAWGGARLIYRCRAIHWIARTSKIVFCIEMLYGKIAYDPENDVIVVVHIPKTGGWSLVRALEGNWGKRAHLRLGMSKVEKVYRSGFHRAHSMLRMGLTRGKEKVLGISPLLKRRLTAADRLETRLISGHFVRGDEPDLGKRPLYVALVRHPVDRFISDFFFSRQAREYLSSGQAQGTRQGRATLKDPRKEAIAESDIDGYARWLASPDRRALHNPQCQYISGAPTFPGARKAVSDIFYCCAPLERVGDLAQLISTDLDIPKIDIGHANKGLKRPDNFVLADETRAMVEKLFEHDMLLYQHVCEEFGKICGDRV